MTGWLILALLGGAAFALVWRFGRLDRVGLQFVAAALLLAFAGYAWQGNPGLLGSPKPPSAREPVGETPFIALRRDIFGQFDTADRWLSISEAMLRSGNTADAAGVIRSALRAHPNNAILWTGYAHALVLHGGGALSPAADLAFRRAAGLAPSHPGPLLFYGLELERNGRLEEAERVWRRALALAPPPAPWREGLAEEVERLRQARTAGVPSR